VRGARKGAAIAGVAGRSRGLSLVGVGEDVRNAHREHDRDGHDGEPDQEDTHHELDQLIGLALFLFPRLFHVRINAHRAYEWSPSSGGSAGDVRCGAATDP